jgi:hypothetical protein
MHGVPVSAKNTASSWASSSRTAATYSGLIGLIPGPLGDIVLQLLVESLGLLDEGAQELVVGLLFDHWPQSGQRRLDVPHHTECERGTPSEVSWVPVDLDRLHVFVRKEVGEGESPCRA